MSPTDLPFADSLRHLAGWNQTLGDWNRILALSPDGCFIAEWNGSPAGTATTVCYGQSAAWIGMLLVHPDWRGRGMGRALLSHCLNYVRGRGTECVQLDATPDGKRLYSRLGFQEQWTLTRWESRGFHRTAPGPVQGLRPYTESDLNPVAQLDAKAFGVARPELLGCLLREGGPALLHATGDDIAAYGVLRTGMRAQYLGPLAATSPASAALLVRGLLARSTGDLIYWDIPDANLQAVAMARDLGFTAQRHLTRMILGPDKCPGDTSLYFAIADPSIG